MPLLISHEISLHAGVDPEEFERFVQEQDYPTCPAFRSLLAFTVVGDAEVPGLYREFILVTDAEAFARDMDSKEFRRLEEKFGAWLPQMEWINFGGGQVDITSGKFVFSASEAWWVEGGKLQYPVKGATIIGNGPEVLKHISMIGNDTELDSGVGVCGKDGQSVPVGVGQPTLRIDAGLTVGGSEI